MTAIVMRPARRRYRPEAELYPFGKSPELDLDWCVVHTLDEVEWRKVDGVVKHHRKSAILGAMIGLTWQEFQKLPADRQEEVSFASSWLDRPYTYPVIGRPIASAL